MKTYLLQCKFIIVEFLNLSYNLIPNPIRKCYLRIFGIKIGKGSCIHRCCKFFHIGKTVIGKNSVVNFGCYLDNRRGITIGDNVGIAHNVKIYTLGHNIDSADFETKGAPVIIEDGVFIFANVMIMPGVTIHENAVILPGSVVTKDVASQGVYGGNPAKFIRERNTSTPPRNIVIGSLYKRKNMNIMFVLKTFEMGGLEVVTTCLANKFVEEGNNVSIFAFADAEHSIVKRLDKRVKTYTLQKLECSEENVYAMRSVMVIDKVQIVINQWGLPFVPLKTARKAAKGLDVKFISVYHNTPDMNGRIQSINDQLVHTSNYLMRLLFKMKRYAAKQITSYGMRWNHNHSDIYMVLSPSFIDKFKTFTGIKKTTKLIVQTNPVTIDTADFSFELAKKQKEIIYVGRIDYNQKRVYRVIDTWVQLEDKFPDWKLTIVGDGIAKEDLEKRVKILHLKNVYFEGFQSPIAYYKRASILLLTSEFEGFPLVLAEAMNFGVVPAVYGSYSAVFDIIKDNINGLILPYNKHGYDASLMAKKIGQVITNPNLYQIMAQEAIKTSKNYSLDSIYKSWIELLKKIN